VAGVAQLSLCLNRVHATFIQKFCLHVLAGFAAACLYYLFMHVFQNFDDAVNKGWNTHSNLSVPVKR
jgi:hypothetical protein